MSKSSLARGLSQVNTDIMSVGTRYGLDELSLVKLRTGLLIAFFLYLEKECMRKVAYSV